MKKVLWMRGKKVMNIAIEPMLPGQIKKGEILYKEKEVVDQIAYLAKGKIKAIGKYGEFEIASGNFLGLLDAARGTYLYEYRVEEELVYYPYHFEQSKDIESLWKKENAGSLVYSMVKQAMPMIRYYEKLMTTCVELYEFAKSEYEAYQTLCHNYQKEPARIVLLEQLEPLQQQDAVNQAESEYQKNLDQISFETLQSFYGTSKYITMVQINNSLDFMSGVCSACDALADYIKDTGKLLISKGENNLFAKLADLTYDINRQKGDINAPLSKVMRMIAFVNQISDISKEDIPVILGHFKMNLSKEASQETVALTQNYTIDQIRQVKDMLYNATDKLLAFSEWDVEKGLRFKQLLSIFASYKDKFSSSEELTKVRREISKLYLELFEAVFLKTLEKKEKNLVVDLFLDFGFVDEKLLEEKQLLELASLKRDNDCGQYPIYTIREWLEQIYYGKAEPSKNEFDMDYVAALRDIKKAKHISETEEKEYLEDRKGKVLFEIRNMFTATNKVTNGRILVYCPILFKENILDSIDKILVQKSVVRKAFEALKEVDYSLFYRSVLYHDKAHGIEREHIEKEVLPITILMPNNGIQGSMWQETSGAKKDTPARFAFPIMTGVELSDIVVTIAGRYRWEICKNIQGVYWSDITEKSLTSEYYDYIQFYRNNRDLTAVAKDKIKHAIIRARNNYREVFVQDYIQWVKYESEGIIKLNKQARNILLTYCPFKKEVRKKLHKYPAFSELMDRFEIQRASKIRKIENAYLSITRNGGQITEQLEENLDFYKR